MLWVFFYVFLIFFDAIEFYLVVLIEGEASGMCGSGRIGYEVFGVVGLFAADGCFDHV